MGKMNKTPNLRFKGFSEEWNDNKFGSVFNGLKNNTLSRAELNDKTGRVMNVHYGDILVKFGDVLDVSSESLPFITQEALVEKYKTSFLQDGDIIIADTAEDEAVGKCTEIIGSEGLTLIAGLHTMPCRPKDKFAKKYLGYYMNSPAYHMQLVPLMHGIKVTSVSKTAIQNTDIAYPKNVDEQARIGGFFSGIDDLIKQNQVKLEKLRNMKKSCLQKMFAGNSMEVPDIRFEGFSAVWEKRTLGSCFDERLESMPSGELLSVTIGSGIKKFSDLGRHDNSNSDKSKYKKVCVGDIAYNSMRMWQGASGYSPFEGIVSPAYTVLKPKEGIDSQFFAYMFKRKDMIHLFEINSQGLTSDTWNLKYPAFSKIVVRVPEDFNEQRKIAEFMQNLDKMIVYAEQELELTKRMKKGCLQKMFV